MSEEQHSYVDHFSTQLAVGVKEFFANRPVATSFDWELQQALIHLRNAMAMTDNHRAHLLNSAASIVKGVKES